MKLWIRVDACLPRDPVVAEFADLIGDDLPTAVGRLSMIWCVMAEHAADGWIGKGEGNADETPMKCVPNAVIEGWAMWSPKRGKPRGTMARAFRELFVADDGTVRGWAKRQGALIERMERDRKRHRGPKFRGGSVEIPRDSTSTERNGTEQQEQHPAAVAAVAPGVSPTEPPGKSPAPARPSRTTTTARSGAKQPAKHPHFPNADRVTLHAKWCATVSPIDFGRFVKGWSPVYGPSGPLYPLEAQLAAIEAFRDGVEVTPIQWRNRWTVEKCVAELGSTWIRLGAQGGMDGDGNLTERGRMVWNEGRKVS